MNNIKEIIDKYGFKIKKYNRTGNVSIIDTDKGIYAIKKKRRSDKEEIFNYLKSKQFGYFLNSESDLDDKYEIFPFVNDTAIEREEKGPDLIYIMSLLHNKTTFYQRAVLDDTKKFYEDRKEYLEYIRNYYDNILWVTLEQTIVSPSNYFLQRNITLIYNSIDVALYNLEGWHNIVKDKESRRVAMTHNNIDDSHLLVNESAYLISWDNCRIDSPIYDFYNFFKLNYLKFDCFNLFVIYNSKYELLKEEVHLLFFLMAVPEKMEFISTEVENTKKIHDYIRYLHYVSLFISKYNSKYHDKKPDQ